MSVSGRKKVDKNIFKHSDSEELCSPCYDNKKLNILAYGFCKTCCESLCHTCYNHHTTPRLYNEHVLQQIPCTESETFTNKCPLHHHHIQFYCPGHHHYGCATCFATDHRTCLGVTYVEDEYQKLASKFDQLDAQIEHSSETARKNKVEAEELYHEVLDNKTNFKQKIADFLNANDTEEIKESIAQKIEDQNKMEILLKTYETIKNYVQDLKQSVQILYNNKQTCELLKRIGEIEIQVKDSETIISELENLNTIAKYRFEPNKELQEALDNVTTLGEIKYEEKEKCAHDDDRVKFNAWTCFRRCGQWVWIIFKLLVFLIIYFLWIGLCAHSKREQKYQEISRGIRYDQDGYGYYYYYIADRDGLHFI